MKTLTAANHAATASYAAQRATFNQFNNINILGRDAQGWLVRTTKAVAAKIAEEYAMDTTTEDGVHYRIKRHLSVPHCRLTDAHAKD